MSVSKSRNRNNNGDLAPSFYLKERLAKGEIEGVKTNYCLNSNSIALLKQIFDDFYDGIVSCDTNC